MKYSENSHLRINVQLPTSNHSRYSEKRCQDELDAYTHFYIVQKLLKEGTVQICSKYLMLAGLEAKFPSTGDVDTHLGSGNGSASSKVGI